jgi:hypothetical protein
MTATSSLAKIPTPEVGDRVDGPTAFSNMAKKLEDVAVVPYANSSTRTSAYASVLPARTPVTGSVSYLINTQSFEYYNGSIWTPIINNNLPKGIIDYAYTEAAFPSTGYLASGIERLMSDMLITGVSLITGRIYRISMFLATVDGGPGSSPTTGGGVGHIRYTTTATAPTITSPSLVYGRASVLSDDSLNAQSMRVERVWAPAATGTYSFAGSINVHTKGGIRTFGSRQLVLEDLGLTK